MMLSTPDHPVTVVSGLAPAGTCADVADVLGTWSGQRTRGAGAARRGRSPAFGWTCQLAGSPLASARPASGGHR